MSVQPLLPVLTFSHGRIHPVRRERDLVIAGDVAFKRGYFNDFHVIDAGNRLLKARSVRRVGYASPLWGFRLMRSRQVQLSFDFEAPLELSIEEVREQVKAAIYKQRSFWGSGWDIGELTSRVNGAMTVQEIVDLLDPKTA